MQIYTTIIHHLMFMFPKFVQVGLYLGRGRIYGGGRLIFGIFFVLNWASLHARLNSNYEARSYKERSTKKITGYRKFV